MPSVLEFLKGHSEPYFEWKLDTSKTTAYTLKKAAFAHLRTSADRSQAGLDAHGHASRRYYRVAPDNNPERIDQPVSDLLRLIANLPSAQTNLPPLPSHNIRSPLHNEAQLEARWQMFYGSALEHVFQILGKNNHALSGFDLFAQMPLNDGLTEGDSNVDDSYRLDLSIGPSPQHVAASANEIMISIELKRPDVLTDDMMDALDEFHKKQGVAWVYKTDAKTPKLTVVFEVWPKKIPKHRQDTTAQGLIHVVDSGTMGMVFPHDQQFRSNGNRYLLASWDLLTESIVFTRSSGYRTNKKLIKHCSYPLVTQFLALAVESALGLRPSEIANAEALNLEHVPEDDEDFTKNPPSTPGPAGVPQSDSDDPLASEGEESLSGEEDESDEENEASSDEVEGTRLRVHLQATRK